jgi:hypothetical protein
MKLEKNYKKEVIPKSIYVILDIWNYLAIPSK